MKKYGKLAVSITLGLALATVGMADSYAAPVIEGANVTATDEVAVAIGSDIKIEGTEAIGIGSCIKANGMNEIAIGFGRESIGDSVTGIGNFSEAYGTFVVGVGSYQILGNPEDGYEGMVGIGDCLAVYSSYGTAVGFCAESRGEGAVAIGSDTQAVSAYSVALGAKSIAGDAVAVSSATIAGTMYDFAGADPFAVVSVGNARQKRQIQYVAAGRITEDSTDAINGSQLFGVIEEVNKINDRVTTIESGYVKKVEQNGDDLTFTQVAGSNGDGTPNTDTSFTYTDKHITDLQQSMNGYTDANKGQITTTITTNEKDADGNDKTYESKVDISGYVSDAIREEAKDATITVDGNETTIENAITNNKNDITNIYNSVSDNTNRINSLSNRLNKVGAGAAALASLHPMDFDPDDKLSFAAGIGNYAGANAGAVGVFYRPNEKVMMNVGATLGNGENMVSAGVSFALGKGGKVNASKVAMAHEIEDLRSQVAELTAMVSSIVGGGHYDFEQGAMMFPDVEENHWAYDYINKLAHAGIIEGYPTGNFDGDRTMTRYEFAAMLYRALEKGVQIDNKLLNEFKPELGRIRIDHIRGEGTKKVERIRVNTGKDRDSYGSK